MSALRRHSVELAIVIVTSVAALAVLRLVDTQIFPEPWTIDPWLYTALMTNFDSIYGWFNGTYYASRLPMIVPGVFLNSFLSPVNAYVVLHLGMFLSGGGFLYLLVRELFGVRIALFVYPAFLVNAAYVDAHTWDYFDGFVITYLAGGLYFLVSTIGTSSRLRLTLAGFFFAAAVATNLFATLLVIGSVVAYFIGRLLVERRFDLRRLAHDAAWFVIGSGVLLGACALFARQHGGRLLFFMPSIDAARRINLENWKLPTYDWLWAEPRLVILPIAAATAALAWPSRRRSLRDPVGLALTLTGLGIFALLVYWEFARSGTFLQLSFYFDTLYPFMFVALAAAVVSLVGSPGLEQRLPLPALAALGLVVGAAPLIVVYEFEGAQLWGRRGSLVVAVLLFGPLAAAAGLRFAKTRRLAVAVAPFAAALVVMGVNYASAASATTHLQFETDDSILADADDVFTMGIDLERFMKANDLEETLPALWFDESGDPSQTGLASLYFYGYSLLGFDMPKIDDVFKAIIENREPRNVVFLCVEPTCRDGASAMRRAGYRIRKVAATTLSSGPRVLWVEAYALPDAGAPGPLAKPDS